MNKAFKILLCFFITFSFVYPAFAKENVNQLYGLYLKEQYDIVIKECEKMLEDRVNLKEEPRIRYLLALSLLKNYRIAEAQRQFEIIITDFPYNELADDAHASLADSYKMDGKIEKAIIMYNNILIKFPNSELTPIIYFKLAESYRKKGVWTQARYYFKKIIENYPQSLGTKQAKEILRKNLFYFTIQIGAFKNKFNATCLKKELETKGYNAYITTCKTSEGVFYRVRVGQFENIEQAKKIQERLKNTYPTKIYP